MDGIKTRDARTLNEAAQEDLRRKAVKAVVEGGLGKAAAGRLFGVQRETVSRWVGRYRREGEQALGSRGRRGRPLGACRALDPKREQELGRMVAEGCPDAWGLDQALWTREAVGRLAAERFGVKASPPTVGKWLRRQGLTPQKPLRQALEQDSAAVGQWLEQDYPAIRERARREGATIYWADEAGLGSGHQTGTTWGLKGKTPAVKVTGKRFGANMIAALCAATGALRFMVFGANFTAAVFIGFLARLLRDHQAQNSAGRGIFLILDNHSVHKRSKKVKAWLAERPGQIELFFLPTYSPELNPAEFLNQDMKGGVFKKRRPRDKKDLMALTRSWLRSRQRSPAVVANYFRAPSVRYAAHNSSSH